MEGDGRQSKGQGSKMCRYKRVWRVRLALQVMLKSTLSSFTNYSLEKTLTLWVKTDQNKVVLQFLCGGQYRPFVQMASFFFSFLFYLGEGC